MSGATTFDTLKFTKRLEEAGVSRDHAEAHAEAFREAQGSSMEEIATKADLRELEVRLMGEMRLNRWMLVLIIAVTTLPALKTLFGL